MGGFASIARSLGDFGSQVGQAKDIALGWRERQQQMAIAAAKQKLQEEMLPLQLQEIKARLAETTQPKPYGTTTTRGGGLAGVTFEPGKGYSLQPLEAGADAEKVKKQILDMASTAPKEFQPAIAAHAAAIDDGADPLAELKEAQKILTTAGVKESPTGTTLNRLQQRAVDEMASGNFDAAQETMKEIHQLATVSRPTAPTQWSLRVAAVTDPGPEGDTARKVLKAQEDDQLQLVKARGLAFGQGRLYSLQDYILPDGTMQAMTGFEYLKRRDSGEQLTPTGRLSPQTIIGYQRLQSEATPALEGVRANLGTFDNASDRAIFARVLSGAGKPEYGSEAAWISKILDQVATDQLSPEGQRFKVNMARLADTMGLVRQSMALPATDSAMNITMSMLPGPATPDAHYAQMQWENLKGIIYQSANIPMFSNMPNTFAPPKPPRTPPNPNAPPPGATVIPYSQFMTGQQ